MLNNHFYQVLSHDLSNCLPIHSMKIIYMFVLVGHIHHIGCETPDFEALMSFFSIYFIYRMNFVEFWKQISLHYWSNYNKNAVHLFMTPKLAYCWQYGNHSGLKAFETNEILNNVFSCTKKHKFANYPSHRISSNCYHHILL